MFHQTCHTSAMEREILHAAQDLIRDGIEPTSGRIAKLCPDLHKPTIKSTRSRLIRNGLLVFRPTLRIYRDIETAEPDPEIVTLPQESALDRICGIDTVDRRSTCSAILKIFRETFVEAM